MTVKKAVGGGKDGGTATSTRKSVDTITRVVIDDITTGAVVVVVRELGAKGGGR